MSHNTLFPFHHPHTVRLYETDGAGILFYGQIFTLVHNAHEELLIRAGLSPQQIIQHHPFSIPLGHAEADYLSPIRLGEQLQLTVTVAHIGQHSFSLKTVVNGYRDDTPTLRKAVVKTVHVTIDAGSGESIPLPEPILQLLQGVSQGA
jgi:1,4-dihydroxy-2-naphthoyl-CoA hydrolase